MEDGIGKKVVGISYDKNAGGLPKVLLKGVGPIAEHLEAEFKKTKPSHRVIENKDLLEKLFRLPMESEISPDLYELVAILLVHVYAVEAKLREGVNSGSS